MQANVLTMQVDALTMQVDALTMQANALTMQANALGLQSIAKFNSLRITDAVQYANTPSLNVSNRFRLINDFSLLSLPALCAIDKLGLLSQGLTVFP